MYASRSGRSPAATLKPGLSSMLLLLALASGGCSNTQHTRQQAATAAVETHRVATETSRKIDVEDDGLEAQIPPSPAIRLAPDDPSEPFSPSYGPAAAPQGKPASQPKPVPPSRPSRSKFAAAYAD